MNHKDDVEYLSADEHTELADLGVVAGAVVNGFKIVATNRDPKNAPRVSFLFKKSDKLEDLIAKYFEGKLLVDAKTFWATSRELKSRIRIS